MVQRIVKLKGHAQALAGSTVNVQMSYNGIEVLNAGVITEVVESDLVTVPQSPEVNVLAQFETTTDITGQIPVTITVTGGTLFFKGFWMNYSGPGYERQATDPAVAIDPADASTFTWVKTVQPDSYYGDPNTNTVESDGVSNMTKNGYQWNPRTDVTAAVTVTAELMGDWTYTILNGDTVTFDFFVDPTKLELL
jgi:hypothetical protein